jgi:DNA-directed RNA polymerase specialized sigma24 family protein
MTRDDSPPPGIAAGRDFRTTHWSLVMAARHAPTALSQQALEQLCRTYWFPVYAFVRRRGHPPEDAQDLTQGFFARVLATETLLQADAAKGRFRTFLLTLLTRHLATEFERSGALKRGGGAERIELDAADAEARYAIEPRDTVTPELLFERQWADALLGRVLDRLRVEFDGAGRGGRFEVMKGFLLSPAREVSYAEVASKLGMTESAVTSGIFRLRQRYGAVLREEIRQTVAEDSEVEDEIRHLLQILAG